MKTEPDYPRRPGYNTADLLMKLVMSLLLLALVMVATSCGGTFMLRPDGSLSYTTPEILKAPIVGQK